MHNNDEVILKILDINQGKTGNLVVFDYEQDLKKKIKRSFVIFGERNSIRGKHAHKKLTQFLVCISGKCIVTCDDGKTKKEFVLDKPNKLLKVPNQIWSEQLYLTQNTTLLVMCDDAYFENDYIRDYELFIKYRNFLN